MVGAQRGVQVMHQADVLRFVQAAAFGQELQARKNFFGMLKTFFPQMHLMAFFIHPKIPWRLRLIGLRLRRHRGQERRDFVHPVIQLGVIIGLAGDNQWGARFVNQDRIDLVNDGVVERALAPAGLLVLQIVAQVVEAEFVVGAVGDVTGIGGLLVGALHIRQVHPGGEAEEAVEPPHPFSIAAREVVVHRHHMHAVAGQRIQIYRQGRHQGFAFARAHFGDLAFVQGDAANQLHIEMAHAEGAHAGFAYHSEGFRQQVVERGAISDPLFERSGLGAQGVIGQRLHRRFQRIHRRHLMLVLLEQPVVAAAEYFS